VSQLSNHAGITTAGEEPKFFTQASPKRHPNVTQPELQSRELAIKSRPGYEI